MASIKPSRGKSKRRTTLNIQEKQVKDILRSRVVAFSATTKKTNYTRIAKWTIRDARKFVRKITKEVNVVFGKKWKDRVACAWRNPDTGLTISLTKKFFSSKYSTKWRKAVLLHELGHLLRYRCQPGYMEEYTAQMWGMGKAIEMGSNPVLFELIKQIREWAKFNWNDNNNYRLYIKAGRHFIKTFNISKEIHK